jgi:hypothetical protein
MEVEGKVCTRCKEFKPLTEYALRRKKEPWLKSACKACHRERARGYWAKKPLDPEVQREKNLRNNFGIGVKDYESMLVGQSHSCAICRRHESEFSKRLAVDHCHKTGKIRGLLCMFCNTALGKYDDNIALMKAAIEYMERHENGE